MTMGKFHIFVKKFWIFGNTLERDIYCILNKFCLKFIGQFLLYFLYLIAAKGKVIAQLRYLKREKTVSLPKISINILDISKGGRRGSGAGGRFQVKCTIDQTH